MVQPNLKSLMWITSAANGFFLKLILQFDRIKNDKIVLISLRSVLRKEKRLKQDNFLRRLSEREAEGIRAQNL